MPLWRLLHIKAPRGALRYIEFLPLIAFIAIGVYLTRPKSAEVTVSEFKPIELKPFKLVNPGPFAPGESIVIENGLCNKSEMDTSLDITLGLQRGGADPVIDPQQVKLFDTVSYPIRAKTCLADSGPRLVKLPDNLTTGRWRLYAIIVARGKSSLEMQRETILSADFNVQPRGP